MAFSLPRGYSHSAAQLPRGPDAQDASDAGIALESQVSDWTAPPITGMVLVLVRSAGAPHSHTAVLGLFFKKVPAVPRLALTRPQADLWPKLTGHRVTVTGHSGARL